MVTYYKPFFNDNSIFSVDMIRIKFKIRYDCDKLWFINQLTAPDNADVHFSPKSYEYRYMITYASPLSSFTIGFSFFGDECNSRIGFLEFNPNKILGDILYTDGFVSCKDSPFDADRFNSSEPYVTQFCDMFNLIKRCCDRLELARFDLAVDLMVLRTEVQLIKDRRKYSQFRKSSSDLTEYLGARSSAGRVKVYNKTLESELDYDCTRVEITLDSLVYDDLLAKMPEIYLNRSLAVSDDVLVQLLKMLPVDEFDLFFQRLDKRKRSKLKPLLLENKFVIPEHCFDAVCSTVREFL